MYKSKKKLKNNYNKIKYKNVMYSINNYTFELCGYIKNAEDNGKMDLIKVSQGVSKDNTNSFPISCNIYYNYPIIWHTHPSTSKYYPSITDIQKVLKYSTKHSFIFTKYGYWLISCPNIYKGIKGVPHDIKNRILTIHTSDPLTLSIFKILKNFYKNTNKGREYSIKEIKKLIIQLNTKINNYNISDFNISWIKLSKQNIFN
jgi:hypothetical protein